MLGDFIQPEHEGQHQYQLRGDHLPGQGILKIRNSFYSIAI